MHGEIEICCGIFCAGPYGKHTRGEPLELIFSAELTISRISRPKLESLAVTASRAPLLGIFGAFMHDWIPLIDEYYYCAWHHLWTIHVHLLTNFRCQTLPLKRWKIVRCGHPWVFFACVLYYNDIAVICGVLF